MPTLRITPGNTAREDARPPIPDSRPMEGERLASRKKGTVQPPFSGADGPHVVRVRLIVVVHVAVVQVHVPRVVRIVRVRGRRPVVVRLDACPRNRNPPTSPGPRNPRAGTTGRRGSRGRYRGLYAHARRTSPDSYIRPHPNRRDRRTMMKHAHSGRLRQPPRFRPVPPSRNRPLSIHPSSFTLCFSHPSFCRARFVSRSAICR